MEMGGMSERSMKVDVVILASYVVSLTGRST